MAQITPQQAGGVNVVAFLDMLAWSEGTDNGKQPTKDRGYDVIVGGQLFSGYRDHPRDGRLLPHDERQPDLHLQVAGRSTDPDHQHLPGGRGDDGAAERHDLHRGPDRGAAGVRLKTQAWPNFNSMPFA